MRAGKFIINVAILGALIFSLKAGCQELGKRLDEAEIKAARLSKNQIISHIFKNAEKRFANLPEKQRRQEIANILYSIRSITEDLERAKNILDSFDEQGNLKKNYAQENPFFFQQEINALKNVLDLIITTKGKADELKKKGFDPGISKQLLELEKYFGKVLSEHFKSK